MKPISFGYKHPFFIFSDKKKTVVFLETKNLFSPYFLLINMLASICFLMYHHIFLQWLI